MLEDVEDKDDGDVTEMGKYFISSEILEEWALVHSLLLSAF